MALKRMWSVSVLVFPYLISEHFVLSFIFRVQGVVGFLSLSPEYGDCFTVSDIDKLQFAKKWL